MIGTYVIRIKTIKYDKWYKFQWFKTLKLCIESLTKEIIYLLIKIKFTHHYNLFQRYKKI